MIKKVKSTAITILLVILTITCCVALMSSTNIASANIFTAESGVNIELNKGAPSETNIDDERKGMLLTSSQSNSKANINGTFKGVFEIDFRIFSKNSESDLNLMSIQFVNKSGESFNLLIKDSVNGYPEAYVELLGTQYGKTYTKDTTIEKDTLFNNINGIYTALKGTSFNNKAKINASLVSSKSNIIGFDPSSMSLYAYSYGEEVDVTNRLTIVNLTDRNVIGEKEPFDSFNDYTVSIKFDSIKSGKTANMLVYSINGYALSNGGKNSKTTIYAPIKKNIVVDKKYYVSNPTAYSFKGQAANNFTVKVEYNGSNINLYNNENIVNDGVYAERMYFIAENEGVYTIKYCEDDSNFIKLEYNVYAYEKEPIAELSLQGSYDELIDNGVIKNNDITIYPLAVSSELYYFAKTQFANVKVCYNDKVITNFDNITISKDKTLKVQQPGKYNITYYFDSKEIDNYTFEVVEDKPIFDISGISRTFNLGDRFVVPFINVKYKTETKKAGYVLTYPDNSSSQDTVVKFNMPGQYRLTYYANFGGVIYSEIISISVERNAGSLFQGDANTLGVEKYTMDRYPFSGGYLLKSKKNAIINYSLDIDLNNNVAGSELLDAEIIPNQNGIADFQKLILTFTDTQNKNNYFKVQLANSSLENGMAIINVRAGATGQPLCGYNNGVMDSSSLGGTPILASFSGENRNKAGSVKLYFDYSTCSLYIANGVYYENITLVACFADKNYFGNNTWNGVTNGKVKCTIAFEGQTGASANVLIKSIGGETFANNYSDSIAPSIDVDMEGYEIKDLPIGYVGVAYPLFTATAFDSYDGNAKEVKTRVFKDYGLASMKDCDSDVYDSIFIPAEVGNYAIQYSATDFSNNVATKIINILVYDFYPPIKLKLGFKMPSNLKPGEKVNISEYSVSGGAGNLSTKIYVKDGAEKTEIEESFSADKPGNYKIVFEVTDFSRVAKSFEYEIVVANITLPTFISLPDLKAVVINGSKLDFKDLKAVYYNNGILEAEVSVDIVYNGNTVNCKEDSYQININEDSANVIVKFLAKNPTTNEINSIEKIVKVVDLYDKDELLKMERLFETENIDRVIAGDNMIGFFADSTKENTPSVSFINNIVASGFSMSLGFTEANKSKLNYTDLKVTLTDSQNRDIAVDLYLTKRTAAYSTSYFGINKKDFIDISSSFFGNASQDFNIIYNAHDNTIIDGNNARVLGAIETTKYGKPFEGFTSGKICFEVEILNQSGAAYFTIKSIANQPLGNSSGDFIEPQINKMGIINNFVNQGDKIVIPKAIASDVIFGECIPKLTIVAPDKSVICASVDVDKPFEFTANQCGVYNVTYTASDGIQPYSMTYAINSRSTVKPIITIKGDFANGKVGEKVYVPTATVDNLGEIKHELFIIAISPAGEYIVIKDDNAFIAERKGKYTIRYYARDVYYNYMIIDHIITIS